ncbi:hypothetical protein FA13DRAFT_1587650, partial [Coprinellus micaceus]
EIKERKAPKPCPRTTRVMEGVIAMLKEMNGISPTEELVWKGAKVRKGITTSQKFSAFTWKTLHDGQKIGRYWLDMGESTIAERGLCKQCPWEPTEPMEHIMTQCKATGQKLIWKFAKRLWRKTGLEWIMPTMGMILGIHLAEVKGSEGKKLDGRTRLLQIIISEFAYLIWLVWNEWKIEKEQDERRRHTANEIEAGWKVAITKRLRLDWVLTNKYAHGKLALRWGVVKRTW